MKKRNIRVRQHIAYFRRLTFIPESLVPDSTLRRLYDGQMHPRLRFMVGGKKFDIPGGES